MKKLPALIIAAMLSAPTAAAIAGPNQDTGKDAKSSDPWSHVETFEWSSSSQGARLGIMVMSMTPELRNYFGAPNDKGVLVAKVEPGSSAAKAGIKVGDVLVSVKGNSIGDASDVIQSLSDSKQGDKIKVSIVRDHKSMALDATLTMPPSPNAQREPQEPDWVRKAFPWFDDWPQWQTPQGPHRSPSSRTPTSST